MKVRGEVREVIDAEFVVVGAIALVGLLASARATAFRPPMALGIVYVPTAVVVGLQWYRGVAFGVHHAATVACMSVLAAALLVVSGDLSTAQATVVTVVALMLLVGSASRRYRLLLGGYWPFPSRYSRSSSTESSTLTDRLSICGWSPVRRSCWCSGCS